MTHKVTKDNIALVSRMYAVGCTQEDLAPLVGLSDVKTFRKHYGDYMRQAKTVQVDEVCGSLMKLIKKGNFQAIKFWLLTQGGFKLDKAEVVIPIERVDKIKVELVNLEEHEEGNNE